MQKDNKVENSNEVLKLEGNQLATQNFFVGQIKKMFATQSVPLSDYQIKIGNNAVAKMIQMAQQNNKDVTAYPQAQTLFTLQNIISNEWDVLQGEGVIVFQNNAKMVEVKDSKGNPLLKDGKVVMKKEWHQYFDLRPSAKGHIKTVRMYAAGTNKINPIALSYVVYAGDDFTDIEYVGIEIKPPMFKPKRLSNKVTHVVYALNMSDGTIQYVVGHREQVKPALIAQAKNNGAPDKDLDRMNALQTVDEILAEYENKTFTKKRYEEKKWVDYEVPYFNDTWIAGYNREQMLETKLRGVIANRMIEKEFNNEFQKKAFEHVIVERPREQLKERNEQLVEQSQSMIEESSGAKTEIKTDPRMKKTLTVVKEDVQNNQQQQSTVADDEVEVVDETPPNDDGEEEIIIENEQPQQQDEEVEEEETQENLFDFEQGFNL